ncbi:hypothetical protein RRG08_001812 [Elysia crispata]|uniref:Uncharacterized protein n=1 Tax=Elysia crispata TaxID=231223 RepID=A0AAE0Y7F7_9GAST|nr:hypothetical protein RRG08_001812 [Elysia crispata]
MSHQLADQVEHTKGVDMQGHCMNIGHARGLDLDLTCSALSTSRTCQIGLDVSAVLQDSGEASVDFVKHGCRSQPAIISPIFGSKPVPPDSRLTGDLQVEQP